MSQVWLVIAATDTACLFLGFLFGRLTRATIQIEESMVTDEDNPKPKTPTRRRRVTGFQVMSGFVVAIGLITALVGFQVTRNQDRIVGCVVGYSNASSAAFKARAAAQNEVNEHLDDFMNAVLQAFSTAPADARQLIFDSVKSYNEARAKAKTTQRDNPLPEPPEDACAELLE